MQGSQGDGQMSTNVLIWKAAQTFADRDKIISVLFTQRERGLCKKLCPAAVRQFLMGGEDNLREDNYLILPSVVGCEDLFRPAANPSRHIAIDARLIN